jgi:hypothetical protein
VQYGVEKLVFDSNGDNVAGQYPGGARDDSMKSADLLLETFRAIVAGTL